MRNIYDFHGKYILSIEGKGDLFNYLNMQFEEFHIQTDQHKSNSSKNRINCKVLLSKNDIRQYENSISNKREKFYRSKDKFIISQNGHKITLNGFRDLLNQNEIFVSPKFDKMKFNLIIDYLIKSSLVNNNRITLVHAAAISKNDQGILLPAWKSSGKTKVCYQMLNAGYNYMAEDKVWIGEDSVLYSFPRYLVVKNNNIQDFNKHFSKYYVKYGSVMFKLSNNNWINKHRIICKIINKLQIKANHLKLNKLLPATKVQSKAIINKAIVLYRGELKISSNKEYASLIQMINNFEWNNSMLQIAAAHDYLFPEQISWVDEINKLINIEYSIIKNAIDNISCDYINVEKPNIFKKIIHLSKC